MMKIMSPMSTISIQKPEFHILLFNGSPTNYKCTKITSSWNMSMDSKNSSTMDSNRDMKNLKKKDEFSVKLSMTPVRKVDETLSSNGLQFDRLQPSDQELVRENRFEFGQFVAREAVLDEEYWTAAWLRAESHWENRTYERYIDIYKRKFADQEFNAVKRRCKVQNGDPCACIIAHFVTIIKLQLQSGLPRKYRHFSLDVRKEQKNVKRSIIKSVVGTLDLNIRYLLQGESFPGERVKTPFCCSTNRTPLSRYGYIANLCVAKSARRQGIASNMMYFAVECAKSNGVRQVYVHVDRNNTPAQLLYQKMGFEMVETANSRLLLEETYLLRLQT